MFTILYVQAEKKSIIAATHYRHWKLPSEKNLNHIRFSSFNITKHHLLLSILQTRQWSIYISTECGNDIGEDK